MALAQYRFEPKNINITKRMPAPKKVERIEAWFKQARKMIPEIPSPENSDWQITHQEASVQWIKYEMHNSIGERCYVIIDRNQPFMGAN